MICIIIYASLRGHPVALSPCAIIPGLSVAARQRHTGAAGCEGLTRRALPVADALAVVEVGRVRGWATEVADAFALAAVEDVIDWTPGILCASPDTLAEGHVESVASVASRLVWTHAAAGGFVEDLRSFACWSLLAYALALRAIKLLSCRANWSWVGAFTLTCFRVPE